MGFSRQEHWSGLPFPSPVHESEKWKWSRSVVPDSLRPHGLQPTRLLHPWDFSGKNKSQSYTKTKEKKKKEKKLTKSFLWIQHLPIRIKEKDWNFKPDLCLSRNWPKSSFKNHQKNTRASLPHFQIVQDELFLARRPVHWCCWGRISGNARGRPNHSCDISCLMRHRRELSKQLWYLVRLTLCMIVRVFPTLRCYTPIPPAWKDRDVPTFSHHATKHLLQHGMLPPKLW